MELIYERDHAERSPRFTFRCLLSALEPSFVKEDWAYSLQP